MRIYQERLRKSRLSEREVEFLSESVVQNCRLVTISSRLMASSAHFDFLELGCSSSSKSAHN